MDVYLASDGGIVQIPHALSAYDSLDGVYADVSATTGIVAGNVLLFTEDGRELKQQVLEELWERGGGGSGSNGPRQVVYLFNRETFFSEPEAWAAQLREEVVLPPPLDSEAHLSLSAAQAPFAVAYDHLLHLQSLFKAQAHALRIAHANLEYHLQPILDAFGEFEERAESQLQQQDRLLRGYSVDMAMLPKVFVHESLFRRRDKEESRRKTLADWIHTKKMAQVHEWCQTAHSDYVERFSTVADEMKGLEIESQADRQQGEHRIMGVEHEFAEALGRIELAGQQLEALMEADDIDFAQSLRELDEAMREDLASMTAIKNDFTLDLHVHLRHIAEYQVRITKFTRPMTDLDVDLRQKNAFPHLERLHSLPFAYAANVIELVHRKDFATALSEFTTKLAKAVNDVLAAEGRRRQQHKDDNQLPWEITPLEGSLTPQIAVAVGGGNEVLSNVALNRRDLDDLKQSLNVLKDDPELQGFDDIENPIPQLLDQITMLISNLNGATGELDGILRRAVAGNSTSAGEVDELRTQNDEYRRQIADLERGQSTRIRELEERYQTGNTVMATRQAELQEELVRLRTDLAEENLARQQLASDLEEKQRESEDRLRDLDEANDLIASLQAEIAQEKDRATDLGVRLQEALLDVDGLRSAEHTLITQIRDMQEERTRTMTDLGEAQLVAQNYESELAGTKAELQATMAQLAQAQADRDHALKNQSAEAERMMRDHIAEADGDRAVLEHQNLTLTKELETVKAQFSEQLNAAKNAAVRREDGLKAELSFTKAQLRDVQRRETLVADELAQVKESTAALTQKGSHSTELAKDAAMLAGKYHEACTRLMGAISSSTTISGSLSLPPRPKSTAPAIAASDILKDSSVLVRCLEAAGGFELDAFADAVLRTINLARKLSKSCKQYRELSRNKITISNFGKGDLVLFLPTRNAAVNAWAAFNISAPHHFLHVTDTIRQQLLGKDYYLARIVGTDEAVAEGDAPLTNPYGLAEGLRYYSHHVEEWTPSAPRTSRRSISASVPAAGSGALVSATPSPTISRTAENARLISMTARRPTRGKSQDSPPSPLMHSPRTTPPPRSPSPTPQPSSAHASQHSNSSHHASSQMHSAHASPQPSGSPAASPGVSPRASPAPHAHSPISRITSPRRPSPVPINAAYRLGKSPLGDGGRSSPLSAAAKWLERSDENISASPPPPPSSHISPTSPMAIRAALSANASSGSGGSATILPTRRHRASLASTASPPARDFPSAQRPGSAASSIGSPRGLPIPGGLASRQASAKGSPAAPVASSVEGASVTDSFTGPGFGGGHFPPTGALSERRLSKKASSASLRTEDLFKPSPLANEAASAQGGFLSGLSLSRKRNSASGPPGASAVDMLKRFEGKEGK